MSIMVVILYLEFCLAGTLATLLILFNYTEVKSEEYICHTPSVTSTLTTPPSTAAITPVSTPKYSQDELYWLAKIIHAEAPDDTDEGQIAVGNVVMNRVNHPDFPNTIYDVIWQKTGKLYQFSPCGDGGIKRELSDKACKNAQLVLEGKRILPDDILFFYMPTKGNQKDWIRSRKIYKKIGVHRFCY
jgi:N-acetylmuramoyl-L-alanine amidase